jgi:hypothetical protein
VTARVLADDGLSEVVKRFQLYAEPLRPPLGSKGGVAPVVTHVTVGDGVSRNELAAAMGGTVDAAVNAVAEAARRRGGPLA